jgi:DNA-binding MarR family transcriptional regulator
MPEQKQFTEFDNTLLPWLGRTMKLIDLYIGNHFQEQDIDLTKVQMIMLVRLFFNDGQPQNDLALLTNRDKASLARLLDTMERKRLVVRVPSKEDKRIKLVHITKKGIELYESVRPLIKQMILKVQHGISEQDVQFTIKILKQLQLNMGIEETVAIQTKQG